MEFYIKKKKHIVLNSTKLKFKKHLYMKLILKKQKLFNY